MLMLLYKILFFTTANYRKFVFLEALSKYKFYFWDVIFENYF